MTQRFSATGLTLVEVLIGIMAVSIALSALLGSYLGQLVLTEHSRNLAVAAHDANRVTEQLRSKNSGVACALSAIPPVGTSWDAWLQDTGVTGGGGKSFPVNADNEERIAVTCVRQGASAPPANPGDYCGQVDQVGTGEWRTSAANTNYDPLVVTVAVCWRHRARVIGECTWNGATLTPNDANGNGVIDSPVTVATVVTCKG